MKRLIKSKDVFIPSSLSFPQQQSLNKSKFYSCHSIINKKNSHSTYNLDKTIIGNKKLHFSTQLFLSQKNKEQQEKEIKETKAYATIYQRKTPIQHVLERPDTYVGSLERTRKNMFILKEEISQQQQLEENDKKNVTYNTIDKQINNNSLNITLQEVDFIPALYRIIDEILVNAVDNYHRKETNTNLVKIEIDPQNNFIHIFNNGKSIPIVLHPKENIYIPELVFGYLLTSSNFNDDEIKFTGGRNGYGAKLTNIFSKKFMIEILDEFGNLYKQTWRENMSICEKPEIIKASTIIKNESNNNEVKNTTKRGRKVKVEPYIKVSFQPDLKRFNSNGLEFEENFIPLVKRRIYDLAAINPNLNVILNNQIVNVNHFKDYVKLFYNNYLIRKQQNNEMNMESSTNDSTENVDSNVVVAEKKVHHLHYPIAYKKINDTFEIAVGPSIVEDEFSQMSFVNSIATNLGGNHINVILQQIVKKLMEYIEKNHKDLHITPNMIQNQISLFVNCLIENPVFDSQTKETLTTKYFLLSSKLIISDDFISMIIKETGIIDKIVTFSKIKSLQQSKRHRRKEVTINIPKLEDAHFAGTNKSKECTLILTEGDSAKALAISGLSVIGREYFGVFPLRGKVLNVQNATKSQIKNNEEIQNLMKILGLENISKDLNFEDISKHLRYGKILIMCDQDPDGSHIKGLLINFIHNFYPALLQNNFLEQFITPLIKVSFGNEVKSFYSIREFENWKQSQQQGQKLESSNNNNLKKWKIKYYKGLGTNTAKEAKEYFSALGKHKIKFVYDENTKELLNTIFDSTKANLRKEWLKQFNNNSSEYDNDTIIKINKGKYDFKTMTISDFINGELIYYSKLNNIRTIPNVIDGLKVSQRKVLFSCFKRKLINDEMKVAQLAGYVSEHSAYHHGEQTLHSTITNMAQDFVGSNNIPLLYPSGQFGTRLQGGDDAASARYIFTRLNKLTRLIFMEEDDNILDYNEEDGINVEPQYYVPIIPMILVNGAQGIGTGWSSTIPTFNPLDIIDKLLFLLKKEDNTLEEVKGNDLMIWARGFKGTCERISSSNSYQVNGIYKLEGNELMITELPIGTWTENYKEYLLSMIEKFTSSGSKVQVKEYHTENEVKFILKGNHGVLLSLTDKLKLQEKISCRNMYAFNEDYSEIKLYDSPMEIIKEFYEVRLRYYEKRKDYMINNLQQEMLILENKVKFLKFVTLNQLNLQKFIKTKEDSVANFLIDQVGLKRRNEKDSFEYITSLSVLKLTNENIEKYKKQLEEKQLVFSQLSNSSPKDLWKKDLLRLKNELIRLKFNWSC